MPESGVEVAGYVGASVKARNVCSWVPTPSISWTLWPGRGEPLKVHEQESGLDPWPAVPSPLWVERPRNSEGTPRLPPGPPGPLPSCLCYPFLRPRTLLLLQGLL